MISVIIIAASTISCDNQHQSLILIPNMNFGKNKIDCNDGHSSMWGHFCIFDLHKNVIQQQNIKSITLWSKLLIENN